MPGSSRPRPRRDLVEPDGQGHRRRLFGVFRVQLQDTEAPGLAVPWDAELGDVAEQAGTGSP